jgi:hypothetical protein
VTASLSLGTLFRMAAAKSKRRELKKLRRELVHAAGCTYRGVHKCASIDCLPETLAEAVALGVRIPRSLRHLALKNSPTPKPEL